MELKSRVSELRPCINLPATDLRRLRGQPRYCAQLLILFCSEEVSPSSHRNNDEEETEFINQSSHRLWFCPFALASRPILRAPVKPAIRRVPPKGSSDFSPPRK